MNAPSDRHPEQLSVGGAVLDSTADLVIYAAAIDLDAITAAVGCPPTSARRRGQRVSGHSPAPIGFWSLEAPPTLGFEDKLRFLLASTTSEADVWQLLSQSHDIRLRCVIYLRSWTEGFELPAALLSDLGKRRWALGLAMYSAEGEEVVDAFLSGEPLPATKPSH